MSASIRSLRVLFDTVSDIGTAVRASREFSRLSMEAPDARATQRADSAFLPR